MPAADGGDQRWFTTLAISLALVLLAGIGLGIGIGAIDFPTQAAAPAAPPSVVPQHVYLTVTTSAATEYDTFYPANVSVPHGVPIFVTITCYDPGVNNVTSAYYQVVGTVGGHALYSDSITGAVHNLTSLAVGNVSHTFTVTLPGQAGALQSGAGQPFVNVPIPPSIDGITPTTTSFEMVFPTAGTYTWRCEAPCDPYSMVTPGFMIGQISVT